MTLKIRHAQEATIEERRLLTENTSILKQMAHPIRRLHRDVLTEIFAACMPDDWTTTLTGEIIRPS